MSTFFSRFLNIVKIFWKQRRMHIAHQTHIKFLLEYWSFSLRQCSILSGGYLRQERLYLFNTGRASCCIPSLPTVPAFFNLKSEHVSIDVLKKKWRMYIADQDLSANALHWWSKIAEMMEILITTCVSYSVGTISYLPNEVSCSWQSQYKLTKGSANLFLKVELFLMSKQKGCFVYLMLAEDR